MTRTAHDVFKEGSQTYYYSSYFYPENVRRDITKLYAFVRKADDYVDQEPADIDGFNAFKADYHAAQPEQNIVRSYRGLEEQHSFNEKWTQAFLNAMEQDLHKQRYESMEDLREYMHGSAEVIGLMITRIIGVDGHDEAAKALGRGMQYLNFLRDIGEDQELGRQYIPNDVVSKHDLPSIRREDTDDHEEAFADLITEEVRRGISWLDHGRDAFHAIPYRCRVPIRTATDMYEWTGRQLQRRPRRVYDDTVKPSTARILLRGLCNMIV
jgi:phytoene synthase